jgi:hypothetical protein
MCYGKYQVVISNKKHIRPSFPIKETIMAEQPDIPRRSFFKGLGLAVAAGAAVKAAPPAVSAVKEVLSSASPDGDGYRLTDHIKKYYRSTTI